MKTIFIKENEANREWYIIDANNKPLGRIAARVASVLRGKHKPVYTPNQQMGDFIVIINAEKVAVTGAKATDKMYHHHTGYVGGLKSFTFLKKLERHPEDPLKIAIKGMLPNGRLGRKLLGNVKIYAGENHPHGAQNPKTLEI
ncbi:MAG: 50S ribosomal protein L13 [Treponemataceae bacterium]